MVLPFMPLTREGCQTPPPLVTLPCFSPHRGRGPIQPTVAVPPPPSCRKPPPNAIVVAASSWSLVEHPPIETKQQGCPQPPTVEIHRRRCPSTVVIVRHLRQLPLVIHRRLFLIFSIFGMPSRGQETYGGSRFFLNPRPATHNSSEF